VIAQTTKLFRRLTLWQRLLKWVETGLFVYYIVGIFWIIGNHWICQNQTCDLNVNRIDIGLLIQLAFTISGIINSIRIGIVYLLHDKDKRPDQWFFVSLILSALSYVIFGYYFSSDINGFIQYSNNLLLYALLGVSVFASTVIILTDKQSWHLNSSFVQTRISLSLFNLIILFFSPVLGFFSSLLIIPALIFIDDTDTDNNKHK
jgi:hypothetical protein